MNWQLFFAWVPFTALAVVFLFGAVPCRLRFRGLLTALAFLAVCAAKNIVYRHLGGDPYWPDLPRAVVISWDCLNAGLLMAVPMAMVFGLVAFFMPLRVRRFAAAVLAACAWIVGTVGVWSTQIDPRLVEIEARCPNLPPQLEGLRIVQLSDLHVCATTADDRIARVVERVNALRPDLVALTGDYADGWSPRRWQVLEPLRKLKAHDGVFAVPGNHEYYYGYHPLTQKFAQWGIVFLTNTCATVRGGRLAIGGVHHDQVVFHRECGDLPDVGRAFRHAPAGAFRILLSHAPLYARRDVARHGIGLQLSGHTHGGTLPIVYGVVSDYNNGFVRGLYDVNGVPLYVSSGMGEWGKVPIRLFDPTEITLITLKRK